MRLTTIASVVALVCFTTTACTKKNPDYCETAADCSSGEVCDVSAHSCMSGSDSPDAGANEHDAAPPACDVSKPFGPAMEVAGLRDSMASDSHASFTDDELTVVFASNRYDYSPTTTHLFTAHRATRDAAFEPATGIPGIWNTVFEGNPSISSDGNTLYCVAIRMSTTSSVLVMSKRSDNTLAFPAPTTISTRGLSDPSITADGQTLYVSNLENGFLARLPNVGGSFGPAEDLAIASTTSLVSPATSDGLTLFMVKQLGAVQVTKRASTSASWPAATEVTELGSHDEQLQPSWVSRDGCRLYMTYAPQGVKSRIYMATRPK